MSNILEKALVHLLSGEQDKAEVLFHRFMVEKARRIHDKLRQDESVELGEGWDDEIKEEEYFDNGDLETDAEPSLDNEVAPDEEVAPEGDDVGLDVGDEVDDDLDAEEFSDEEGEEGEHEEIADKLDDLEDKISELTAEFDRLMSEFEDEEGVEPEDFEDDDDLGDDELDDEEGEEPVADTDDQTDLADRMDTDLGDDEVAPEEETMESVEEGEEELDDITESVLSELEKITLPGNSEGKEVGTGKTIAGNRKSMLPNHGVDDRTKQAKPYMVKGGNNDSFAREPSPPVSGVDSLVKGARNSRKSFKDNMGTKPSDGDSSAILNSDFASRPATRSPVDGKPSK